MGRSSLLGTEYAPPEPAGRDTAALGPGDSSDSGSDLAGVADTDISDPGLPVDVALRDDMAHSLLPGEALAGSASDSAGTGERRSAGSDAGLREAADIGVDRVFTPGRATDPEAGDLDEDEDADLAFVDAAAGDAGPEDDDEDPDADEDEETGRGLEEEGDNIPKGERGRPARRRGVTAHAPTQPPIPTKPNPTPDAPEPPPGDDKDHSEPADEHDADERKPGRAARNASTGARA